MKTKSKWLLLLCGAVAVFAVPATAQEDDPLVPTCCQKSPEWAKSSTSECCNTTSASQQFKSSCCESEISKGISSNERQRARGGRGGGPGSMQSAHVLVANHGDITREVQEIPNGVRTITTTSNPDLVATLQSHPREMEERMKRGGHVRPWDPLFRELARHAGKIEMKFKNIENGIEVTSTSSDPQAVKLIRAHAYKVNEFVKRGRSAMHETTPLPEGYSGK